MTLMRQVDSAEHFKELFALPHVVVLKHTLTCPAARARADRMLGAMRRDDNVELRALR
jgi:hypothetical protein